MFQWVQIGQEFSRRSNMHYAGYAHVSLIYVYEKSLYHINTKKQGWQHQIYRYHLSFASCCDLQYHNSGLAVNVEKTKMVAMQTIQPHHYLMLKLSYNNGELNYC